MQEQSRMMQNTTLFSVLADLSQLRLCCSAVWNVPICKDFEILVY